MSFWGGPMVPLLWVSDDISGFQSQSRFYLIRFFAEANVHYLRSTSGATCADLLVASSTTSHFPTCISSGRTWLGFE